MNHQMKKSRLSKFTITALFITSLILGFGVWLISKPTAGSQLGTSISAGGKAEVGSTNFDWGTIDYGGGDVTAEFTINNSGTGPLSLSEVSTSCMCTTAQVIINENKSPFFGMHQKSSWIGKIPAGGQAVLKVIFDPAFHGPQGVGPIERQVVMTTTDPQNPKLEFNLKGTVVK